VFPFHLYLNAFRPESTFTTETHAGGGIRDSEAEDSYPDEKLGSIAISHIDASDAGGGSDYGDLTGSMRFTAPDDGNAQDHTVMEVTLPRPLAPGSSVVFHINFADKFPVSIARNGWKRDMLMGGQWFPKVGVFWHGAWNCHQYHSTTEFFSDFGTYNVHLTVPRSDVVGASGVPTGETVNPDGTKTVGFYAEDVGDFAFASSPKFRVTDGTYLSSLGPVTIHVLAHASHPKAGARYLEIIEKTMEQFEKRYGPYPYKRITVIDPEPDSQMEDPTHITEVTAEHEFGHQYWYGMVATNEFEDAWLDEGINSYTEVKVTGAILGKHTNAIDFSWLNLSDEELERYGYLSDKDYDPVTRKAWQFRDSGSYGGVTYGKSALLLATLEGILGSDTMDDAMRTYFMRYRFTHPTAEDFLRTIEEVAIKHGTATATGYVPNDPATQTLLSPSSSATAPGPLKGLAMAPVGVKFAGSSLRPYFNQAVYGTAVLDYAVDSMTSSLQQWWLPHSKGNGLYTDSVVIHRKGDFLLPVTVEIVFDDGTKVREHWDGVDRWTRFTYTKKAKIVSAEVDPDHVVLLDANFYNNSMTVHGSTIPARKLAALWLGIVQMMSQMASWIV
jgi:hypothetical protein